MSLPPEPVNTDPPPPFEPVPEPVDPWASIPERIDADLPGGYWDPIPGDCITMSSATSMFDITVGGAVDIGEWSGVEVELVEFGLPTTLVLGVDPTGALWKLEQDDWLAGGDAPLEFVPSNAIVSREFDSGPAATPFQTTTEVRELTPFAGHDDCVLLDREPEGGADEFWWFCHGAGPIQVERDGEIWTAAPCAAE